VSRGVLLWGTAVKWLFLIAVLLSAYEVAARYLLNAPSNWIHATTTALCAVAFAAGGAYCMVRREHIRVTILTDRLRPNGRRIIEIISLVVGLFYLAGLSYGLWIDAAGSFWRFDHQGRWIPELTPGPPNLPLPTLIKAALLIGAVAFALVAAVQLMRTLRGRKIGG
jgi:TRAP-type C4-dicarboxylate transport system permease small subunit